MSSHSGQKRKCVTCDVSVVWEAGARARWLHLQGQVGTEDEGEAEFVFGEQRAADVVVEVVLEVFGQVAQTPLQHLRLIAAGWTRKTLYGAKLSKVIRIILTKLSVLEFMN